MVDLVGFCLGTVELHTFERQIVPDEELIAFFVAVGAVIERYADEPGLWKIRDELVRALGRRDVYALETLLYELRDTPEDFRKRLLDSDVFREAHKEALADLVGDSG